MDDLNKTSEIPSEPIEENLNNSFIDTEEPLKEEPETSNKDLFEFIGPKNFDYYYRVSKKHANSNSFASFNWCSFLFTPYWLLYRKLYLWFAAYIGATVIIDAIGSMSGLVSGILKLILLILFGVFGNCMYLHHAKVRVRKINDSLSEFTCKEEVLKANGGTNKLAPFILFLITLVLILVISISLIGILALTTSFSSPFQSILGGGIF